MSQLKTVPVAMVREHKESLRHVNRESEKYLELRDSIESRGVLNPIVVRAMIDKDTNEEYYGLVDGLHRYTAAAEVGLTEIPANVIDNMTDTDLLETQIIANAQKVETRPVEYTRQIQRIIALNPAMTQIDLAKKLNMNPAWISRRLNLLKLDDKIAKRVDDGDIPLANAYALSKLPEEEQKNYVESAMTEGAETFLATCHKRVRELKDAKRKGGDVEKKEFEPTARLRKLKEIKDEVESWDQIPDLIKSSNVSDPVEAAKLAVKWTIHMDPRSVEIAKDKFEKQEREREEAKKKRALEREAKKAEEAKEKAEQLQKEINN